MTSFAIDFLVYAASVSTVCLSITLIIAGIIDYLTNAK